MLEELFLVMAETAQKPADLFFSDEVVEQIILEATHQQLNISAESLSAISKASSIFILYLTTCAKIFGEKKEIKPEDIIKSVVQMGFHNMIPKLRKWFHRTHHQNYSDLKRKSRGQGDVSHKTPKRSKYLVQTSKSCSKLSKRLVTKRKMKLNVTN